MVAQNRAETARRCSAAGDTVVGVAVRAGFFPPPDLCSRRAFSRECSFRKAEPDRAVTSSARSHSRALPQKAPPASCEPSLGELRVSPRGSSQRAATTCPAHGSDDGRRSSARSVCSRPARRAPLGHPVILHASPIRN